MLTLLFSSALAIPSTLVKRNYMDCSSAPYCGLLVLETGNGSGNYNHPTPAVHGLWPETGRYGNSGCVGGSKSASIPNVSCYNDYSFQEHEWTAHGVCAAADPDTFFNTVCNLSSAPLQMMADLNSQGYSIDDIASQLGSNGYPVFNIDYNNAQIELSVCAGSDAVWQIADVSQFDSVCNY
ncbi:hypothetical protein HK103_002605 [Boothiomyces macroporosus]|uniref:Uncharacterized protein n=1 Tax=Boothiomyces macroporosus TaxID=261099 RepID=A0AAD5Y4A6_9FUNG|nr:hypothetical protein HK103_002605 [Boothiomyces macroporosus]